MKRVGNVIRDDFPALQCGVEGRPLVYLDNAATTLKPRPVIDAITRHYMTNGANIHRGKHRLSEDASEAFENARLTIADYIGAQSRELVFLRNTTEAINLVAQGLQLPPDATVLGCLDAHHSQILPWRRAASLQLAPLRPDARIDLDAFVHALKSRPAVVTLTHCSNVTGVVHPVGEMIRETRARCDAVIVVDAAQSLPHDSINVEALDADFLAFSPHKMFGPTGLGCLYGRAQSLETLAPLTVGGGTADWVESATHVDRRIPHLFEAGTPAIASAIGAAAAIDYLARIDAAARAKREAELVAELIEGALARPYLRLIGPADTGNRHPIVSLALDSGVSAGEVARLLSDSYGIMCRSGYLCAQPMVTAAAGSEVLRVSAYLYNQPSEIGFFYQALDELAETMGFRCS